MWKEDAEIIRAVLRSAERRLTETLRDLESNDLDEKAITSRLDEIVRTLKISPLAA